MLKALELVGFKSFADKTRFDFPPGITAVVGPNGSGKSNVVDAIRWVLGEQSVKTLRGKEMADVIFNGSASRTPLNFAETTLTLDNSTRRLPIDTPEVLVTRRVYRNGEGEYMLNRQPCRLRDIRELFFGTGVATEAYSIIEQGKVDVLLQSAPRERRLIFEEAAGISRFKAKKVESLRRLERVEQNLLRLGDIVAEVEHRLKQVRHQAGKARRYQEYAGKLQELRTHVGMVDYRQLSAQLEAMEAELAKLGAARDQAQAAAETAESAAATTDSDLAATTDALRTSELQGAQVRATIAAQEAAIEHQRRRSGELEKEASRLRRQLAAVSVRAGSLQQQLTETAAQVGAAEQDYEKVAQAAATEDESLAAASARVAAVRQRADQSRQLYVTEMRRAAQWESESSSLQERLESAELRLKQLETRGEQLTAARQTLDGELAAFDQQETTLNGALDEQQRRETAAHAQLTTLADQQHAIQVELDAHRQKHAAARERVAVLAELEEQREGYTAAVKEVLAEAQAEPQGPFAQVRGIVAELLKVNLEVAPLVELALGERAQHVVVTSLDELVVALGKQPRRFAGQVTFTPIDTRVHAVRPEVDLHGRPGVMGRADDFVQTSTELVPLAERLLGRTWIVQTAEQAASLARLHDDCDFVTVTGEVFAGGRTLSCGSGTVSTGLISRRSELAGLRQIVAELAAKIDAQTAAEKLLASELVTVQQTLAAAEQEHAHLAANLAELRLTAGATRERAKQLDDEQRRAGNEQVTFRQAIETTNTSLKILAERLRTSRESLTALEQQAEILAKETATLDEERARVAATAAAAKIKLGKGEERLANLRLRARQLEQDQRERRRTVDDVAAELAQCVERMTQGDRVILATEGTLAQLYLDKERSAAGTATLLARQEALRAERAAHLVTTQEQRTATRSLEERMHAQELTTHEVRHTRTTLAERMREDYDIDLAAFAAPETTDESRQRDEIDQEIAELRRKIANIGNVNLDALAELDELEARFTHLSNQHRDLTDAKQALEQIIDRINSDSRRLFAETLERVRANFQTLFRKLFGGGQADIILDEGTDLLESGIEIVARPPGKEPRNISLLSGGEKTLTCVALLLAIFQYRPSPFCVLDEVDAALDEANIERFINVLQEFLAWTQFIVVTHSKKTMTGATTLYGVTMQESGVSKRVSVRFEDIRADGKLRDDAVDLAEQNAAGQGKSSSDDETQAA